MRWGQWITNKNFFDSSSSVYIIKERCEFEIGKNKSEAESKEISDDEIDNVWYVIMLKMSNQIIW